MIASARDGIPPDAVNLHGTAVVLGDRGVLVTGPSGSGKSVLAAALLAQWAHAGRHAALVADDQVFATARAGRVVAHAPRAIAGLLEARGFGPAPARQHGPAVIDLMVELSHAETGRIAPADPAKLAGLAVRRLVLPGRDTTRAVAAVQAALGAEPFGSGGRGVTDMFAALHDLGLPSEKPRTT